MDNKNLLENVKLQWTSWSPRKELSPEFIAAGDKLKISSDNNPNVYGKFLSSEICLSGSPAVIFEADYSCTNVQNEEKSIFAMISFYSNSNGEKKMLERNYADIIHTNGGQIKKLYRKLDVPETAEYVILEIGARYCPEAVVEWDNIKLENAVEKQQRIVRIATTYKTRQDTPAENLDVMIDIINKAGESNPDVILLSELVYESCHRKVSWEENSQPIPGNLTDTIGEYAKKYNTYIIFSMNERVTEPSGEAVYNTGVVIGRDGKVCGKYRKTHLPLTEAESGTSPGNTGLNVFDLDFGRIGIIICYDQFFPELSRTLALMGAEIIFIPTMGEDEVVHRAIARTNGVYVVVSGYNGGISSRIVNPLGEIVNFVKDDNIKDVPYVTEQVDLNQRFFTYWMSIGAGNGETKVLFRTERVTDNYDAINKESYKLR